jgi:hypothetical protein
MNGCFLGTFVSMIQKGAIKPSFKQEITCYIELAEQRRWLNKVP